MHRSVVLHQYRFKIVHEHCVDYGVWYPWKNCTKVKFDIIEGYISDGNPNYETRELVVKE